jgi:hypothetical protein
MGLGLKGFVGKNTLAYRSIDSEKSQVLDDAKG